MAADEKMIAEFRKKLIEDASFRKSFAANPAEALRSVGIDVPESAVIPPIDAAELEKRVDSAKAILGADVSKLYQPGAFGKLAADRASFKRLEQATNIGTRVGSPVLRDPQGAIYTISAFGTIDW